LEDALTFYRRATELDPQFALAWARRGAAARNVSQYDEGGAAFRKAYELRDRASDPERFYIMAHYYRFVADDPHKALETYKVWRRTYPGSPVPPTNLASLYVSVFGQYDSGIEEAREAVRLVPHSSIAHSALVTGLLGTGRIAEAKQALREAGVSGVADLLWHSLAFEVAFAAADPAGMEEQVRWASGDTAAAMQMNQYRALAAASRGRLGEARQRWADAVSAAAQIGPPAWQAGIRVAEAQAEALLGDPHRARAAADAALELDQHSFTVLIAAIALASSGDVGRAETLLDRFNALSEGGLCLRPVWLAVARALVEAKAGRPERAGEFLRQAGPFERSRDFGLLPLGVRASMELSAGRSAEAAATLDELLRLRGVASLSPWVAFARLELARALRRSGDAARSMAAYDAFLESWKEADVDAPLLAVARRERAAMLH
jgi:tetratricopeptide (TPR) repeat protein